MVYIYILDTSSKGIKKGDYSVIYEKSMRRKKNGFDCKWYRKSKRNKKETKKRSGTTSPRYPAVDTSDTDVNAHTHTHAHTRTHAHPLSSSSSQYKMCYLWDTSLHKYNIIVVTPLTWGDNRQIIIPTSSQTFVVDPFGRVYPDPEVFGSTSIPAMQRSAIPLLLISLCISTYYGNLYAYSQSTHTLNSTDVASRCTELLPFWEYRAWGLILGEHL